MRLVHNFNWILTIPTKRAKAFILPLSQTILIIQVITIAKGNVSTHSLAAMMLHKQRQFVSFCIRMVCSRYLIKIYYNCLLIKFIDLLLYNEIYSMYFNFLESLNIFLLLYFNMFDVDYIYIFINGFNSLLLKWHLIIRIWYVCETAIYDLR